MYTKKCIFFFIKNGMDTVFTIFPASSWGILNYADPSKSAGKFNLHENVCSKFLRKYKNLVIAIQKKKMYIFARKTVWILFFTIFPASSWGLLNFAEQLTPNWFPSSQRKCAKCMDRHSGTLRFLQTTRHSGKFLKYFPHFFSLFCRVTIGRYGFSPLRLE